jgi:hypothetical protein
MQSTWKGQVSVEFISYLSALFLFFTIVVGIVYLLFVTETNYLKGQELKNLAKHVGFEIESVIKGGYGYFVVLKLRPTTLLKNYTVFYYPLTGVVRAESGIDAWSVRILNTTAVMNDITINRIEIHPGDKILLYNRGHYLEVEVEK